jgi:hypothetical protein
MQMNRYFSIQNGRCFGPVSIDDDVTWHDGWSSREEVIADFPKIEERGPLVLRPRHRISDCPDER